MRWVVAIALSLALLCMSSASAMAASEEEAYTATVVWTENTGCTNTQVILKVLKIVKPNLHERSTLQVERRDTCAGDSLHIREVIEDFDITGTQVAVHDLALRSTFGSKFSFKRSILVTSDLIRFISSSSPNGDVVSDAQIFARIQLVLPRGGELFVLDLTTVGEIQYVYHTGTPLPE